MATPESNDAGSTHSFTEKAGQVKDLLAELAHMAPTAAREQLAALKDSAGWLYEEGSNKVREAGTKACDLVKRRPMETVLVGVGLGLLIWWLVSRKGSAEE